MGGGDVKMLWTFLLIRGGAKNFEVESWHASMLQSERELYIWRKKD